jgi:soluble lytic murein transglycosylase-like protein
MTNGKHGFRGGSNGRGESRPELRRQLRNWSYRPLRTRILRWTKWTVAVAALAAVNAAWMFGSIRPRVSELEGIVAAADAADRDVRGERALLEVQVQQLQTVLDFSSRYRIPADLAQAVFEIALSEDLEPDLAFRLVRVESAFRRHAVSEAGAVGYTQILPSTARWMDPRLKEGTLFDRDTNLRLGFRYLRMLLDEYEGDMRLALLAYNRGPGTVQAIVARGGDPANGYATRVIGSE